MRRSLFALLLTAGLVRADPAQYMQGEVLQAEVARIRGAGCVVLAPAEVALMQARVAAEMNRRGRAAFERGIKSEKESCRNVI